MHECFKGGLLFKWNNIIQKCIYINEVLKTMRILCIKQYDCLLF